MPRALAHNSSEKNDKDAGQDRIDIYWGLAVFALAGLLAFKHAGLYAIVFADETTYSKHARLVALEKAPVASYLYFAVYRTSNYCGDGFYACARLLNVACLVGSVPFLYQVARHVTGRRTAIFLSLLALLLPSSSYAAYFMPEAPYFLAMWIVIWAAFKCNHRSSTLQLVGAGVLLGLAAQIKPHALLILPAFALYTLFATRSSSSSWGNSVKLALTYVSGALSAKYAIGVLVAGIPAGLSFLGPLYSTIAQSEAQSMRPLSEYATSGAFSLLGHFLLLSAVSSVGLIALATTLWEKLPTLWPPEGASSPDARLSLLTALLLANSLAIVIAFTVLISDTNPLEVAARLHARYYSFMFPLFAMIAISAYRNQGGTCRSGQLRSLAAAPVVVGLAYVLFFGLSPYQANFVDSPELQGFQGPFSIRLSLCILGLAAIGIWTVNPRLAGRVFVFAFTPVLALTSNLSVTKQQNQLLLVDVFVRAAQATKAVLPADQLNSIVVAGTSPFGLQKTRFYLDAPGVRQELLAEGKAVQLGPKLADRKWVLLVGANKLDAQSFEPVVIGPDFVLSQTKSR